MPTAMEQVLCIRELFEAVLLQLQPLDIIRSQQMSRLFKTTIRQSPAIQRKLFFKRPRNNNNLQQRGATPNPMLPKFLTPTPSSNFGVKIASDDSGRKEYYSMRDIFIDVEDANGDLFARYSMDIRVTFGARWHMSIPYSPRFDAYKDMLVADEPVSMCLFAPELRFGYKKIVGAEDGSVLTFGELVEGCRGWLRENQGQ